MNSSTQAPQAAALVVNRWNSWVQVWFPDSGETSWIDLASTGFAPMAEGEAEEAPSSPHSPRN